MLDGLPAGGGFQIPLGHVGGVVGPVDEDVVPGLILRGRLLATSSYHSSDNRKVWSTSTTTPW